MTSPLQFYQEAESVKRKNNELKEEIEYRSREIRQLGRQYYLKYAVLLCRTITVESFIKVDML